MFLYYANNKGASAQSDQHLVVRFIDSIIPVVTIYPQFQAST